MRNKRFRKDNEIWNSKIMLNWLWQITSRLTLSWFYPDISWIIPRIKPRVFPSKSFPIHYSLMVRHNLDPLTRCQRQRKRNLYVSRPACSLLVAEGSLSPEHTSPWFVLPVKLKLCNISAFPNTTLRVTFSFQELCARLNVMGKQCDKFSCFTCM